MQNNQKITPFLWFKDNAEEAANFYVKVFSFKNEDSQITQVTHYDAAGAKASGQKEGSVMTVSFKLNGQEFTAINGGDYFQFSGAISFVVNCENQEEVDYFWEKLSEKGEKGVCGWINRDKFGVTWQITPTILPKLISDPDPQKAQRAMEAMLKMTKIEIAEIERAANSK